MLRYKFDVLAELKKRGYTTYRMRKEKIFGEATLQKFRNGQIISAENLNTLCQCLDCQPGEILEYMAEETSDNI